jgi:DNA-binding GntR family transcriptional regulator
MVSTERQFVTLNHNIYEVVRRMIGVGPLVPGARIDEQAIAAQLGVSRTPVRDAITRLASEGLIEQRPYRGSFVRELSASQIDGLYETRQVLEGLAARRAVHHATDAELAEVAAILEEARLALDAHDLDGYAAADAQFHATIANLSRNESLIQSLERLRAQVQLVRVAANQDPDLAERTARERPRILAALRNRDADAAAKLMEEHIHGVRTSILQRMREEGLGMDDAPSEKLDSR